MSRVCNLGIIYSASCKSQGFDLQNLAYYLCGSFCETGYCNIIMVPHYDNNNSSNLLPNDRIVYCPIKNNTNKNLKSNIVPSNNYNFDYFSGLSKCNMILIIVKNGSLKLIWDQLNHITLEESCNPVIFVLQKHSIAFTGIPNTIMIGKKKIPILEVAVAFSVIENNNIALNNDCTYMSIQSTPSLVVTRLSKDNESVFHGPCNLLEATGIDILYRPHLNQHLWGIALYEQLFIVCALFQTNIKNTICNQESRMTYACMLRECVGLLEKAAGKSKKWQPHMESIIFVSPFFLEMLLLTPSFISVFIIRLLDIPWYMDLTPNANKELEQGYFCYSMNLLKIILNEGDAFNVKENMPVCLAVYNNLLKIKENPTLRNIALENVKQVVHRVSPSGIYEWRLWTIRIIAIILTLYSFCFFFSD